MPDYQTVPDWEVVPLEKHPKIASYIPAWKIQGWGPAGVLITDIRRVVALVEAAPALANLAEHVLSMEKDEHLNSHPEFAEIIKEAKKILDPEGIGG